MFKIDKESLITVIRDGLYPSEKQLKRIADALEQKEPKFFIPKPDERIANALKHQSKKVKEMAENILKQPPHFFSKPELEQVLPIGIDPRTTVRIFGKTMSEIRKDLDDIQRLKQNLGRKAREAEEFQARAKDLECQLRIEIEKKKQAEKHLIRQEIASDAHIDKQDKVIKSQLETIELLKESRAEALEEKQKYLNHIIHLENQVEEHKPQWVPTRLLNNVIEDRTPRGLFYTRDNKAWIAVDNETGDAWTEVFQNKQDAINWLNGEGPELLEVQELENEVEDLEKEVTNLKIHLDAAQKTLLAANKKNDNLTKRVQELNGCQNKAMAELKELIDELVLNEITKDEAQEWLITIMKILEGEDE